MKTIYLIRHAKSDWNTSAPTDFERPLNKRGLRDAPIIANELKTLNFAPTLVLCSPAQRTTATSELIVKDKKVIFEQSIYEASLKDLTILINDVPNKHSEIALIGHNPSITYLSNHLTGEYISNMPTCSVVKIVLEVDSWMEVIAGIGTQKFFIYPKMFT